MLYMLLVGALFVDRDIIERDVTRRRHSTFALLFSQAGNLAQASPQDTNARDEVNP